MKGHATASLLSVCMRNVTSEPLKRNVALPQAFPSLEEIAVAASLTEVTLVMKVSLWSWLNPAGRGAVRSALYTHQVIRGHVGHGHHEPLSTQDDL